MIVSNTADSDATVHVTLGASKDAPGAKTASWVVPPKKLQVIDLPVKAWGVPNQNQDGSNINNRAFRIQSNQPIVAYQFNPLQNYGVFSNDASLLLPTGSLGTEYWVLSRNQLGDKFRSYVTIVAAMPGTTKVDVVSSGKTLAGPDVPAMTLGQTQSFSLQEGQVLNIESNKANEDLTGSFVKADKPVVVFGGSEASNSPQTGNCVTDPNGYGGKVCAGTSGGGFGTPCTQDADCDGACCADHLEEQMFPVATWGTEYVAARLYPRGKERDAWRILAAQNGTKVTIQPFIGVTVPTLNQGQWFEFESTADFVVKGDKPILVGQYMASSYATVTQENPTCSSDAQCKQKYAFEAKCDSSGYSGYCAPIGDPSLILDVATSQYLADYIFLVPDKYKLNFINVVVPQNADVTLDGTSLLAGNFKGISGSTWATGKLPVAAGAHHLQASKPIGLFVYGYDDDVSYGYSGGAGLKAGAE